jgi:hypothetical protein
MSRTTKNVVSAKKPYCKVCHDAGKPESEYTSHWVKDLTGKNTCPTLLNTECRYCYKLGHTAKFCDVAKKNNKEKERFERKSQAVAPKPAVVQKKPVNGFAALCEDSDSEEEEVSNTIVNEYPSLCQTAKKVEVSQPEVKTGWAAIAAKPKEVKKVVEPTKPTGLVMLSDYIKTEVKVEEKKVEQPKVASWAAAKQVVKKSWADESDSEDDDECNFDDDYKWRTTYVPGLTDDVWHRIENEVDETW